MTLVPRRPPSHAGPARTALLVILSGLLFMSAGCGDDDKAPTEENPPAVVHPQDLLPPSGTDMTRIGSPEVATTAAELGAIINGDYLLYDRHHFQEFARQLYSGTLCGGTSICMEIWIFDMGTQENAGTLYNDSQVIPGGCETIELGDEARLCSSLFSQILQFRRNEYWVRLYVALGSNDARTVITAYASEIDVQIQG